MAELGPNGRWVVNRDIKADPGGVMAIVVGEAYIAPCRSANPGVPIYLKQELSLLQKLEKSGPSFRFAQAVKKVFPNAKISEVLIKHEAEARDDD